MPETGNVSVQVKRASVEIWRDAKPVARLSFSDAAKLAWDILHAVLVQASWPAAETDD